MWIGGLSRDRNFTNALHTGLSTEIVDRYSAYQVKQLRRTTVNHRREIASLGARQTRNLDRFLRCVTRFDRNVAGASKFDGDGRREYRKPLRAPLRKDARLPRYCERPAL